MTQQLEIGDFSTEPWIARAHERRQKKREKESPEDVFDRQLRQHQMPPYVRQARFAKQELDRKWMFDFCWHKYMVAVEIEGVVVARKMVATLEGPVPIVRGGYVTNVKSVEPMLVVLGRHASIQGFKGDTEKYNSAALLGWTVLRFEQSQVKPGHALEMLMRVLSVRGWKR